MKVANPVSKDTVNNGTEIKLGAKSIEHHLVVDARGSCLVYLECMGTFRRFHGQFNNQVILTKILSTWTGARVHGTNM
jgi:hypothetical protein